MGSLDYDQIGPGYSAVRRPDRRLTARIVAALGDARSVVNVGAGAGSYEPTGSRVIAIEPSATMIAQRPAGAANAIQACAESLPLADRSVDAAMAVLSIQHWRDVPRGLAEMRRVARRRLVLVTIDPEVFAGLWLVRDYWPEMQQVHTAAFPAIEQLLAELPVAQAESFRVPVDFTDRFLAALGPPRKRTSTNASVRPVRPGTSCPMRSSSGASRGFGQTSRAARGSGATRNCGAKRRLMLASGS